MSKNRTRQRMCLMFSPEVHEYLKNEVDNASGFVESLVIEAILRNSVVQDLNSPKTEPRAGIEPATSSLPRKRDTAMPPRHSARRHSAAVLPGEFYVPNHRCITIMSESPIKKVLSVPERPEIIKKVYLSNISQQIWPRTIRLSIAPSMLPTSITGSMPLAPTAAITAAKSTVPAPTARWSSDRPSLSWRWT